MISRVSTFTGPLSTVFKHSVPPVPSVPIPSPGPTVSTTVAWSSGTYFNAYTSQSGVTSTDIPATNKMCWQLFYAHTTLTIATGLNVGMNTYTNGTNTITWYHSISTSDNTIGDFPSETLFANTSGLYTQGGLKEANVSSMVSIPANRYFLIGIVNGPYYRTFKSLINNRTAQISSVNKVTAVNKVLYGPWPSGPSSGIPTQVGGLQAGYVEYNNMMSVVSIKFTT